MKAIRSVATASGVAAFALAALAHLAYIQSPGFPDGHLTDLDHARRPVALAFVLASAAFGVGFVALARSSSDARVRRHLAVAAVVYGAVVLLAVVADLHLAARFDSGQGG